VGCQQEHSAIIHPIVLVLVIVLVIVLDASIAVCHSFLTRSRKIEGKTEILHRRVANIPPIMIEERFGDCDVLFDYEYEYEYEYESRGGRLARRRPQGWRRETGGCRGGGDNRKPVPDRARFRAGGSDGNAAGRRGCGNGSAPIVYFFRALSISTISSATRSPVPTSASL